MYYVRVARILPECTMLELLRKVVTEDSSAGAEKRSADTGQDTPNVNTNVDAEQEDYTAEQHEAVTR